MNNTIISEFFSIAGSLVAGMVVTMKYFLGSPVTMQYPEAKRARPERYRGAVSIVIDEKTGKHRCNSCMNCVRVCPVGALSQEYELDANGKRYPVKFTVNIGTCMYCGLCIDECHNKALAMNKEYETVSCSKDIFIKVLVQPGNGEPLPKNDR